MAKKLILTPREEEILRTVHFYRYITAFDITHLSFSPKSITHVREILNKLCGGQDHADNQYLFRFPLPEFTGGKTKKVYTLEAAAWIRFEICPELRLGLRPRRSYFDN